MKTFSAAWTLAKKDLRSFVRDRTALFLSLLVPLALVTVFGFIMAYAFGGPGAMPAVKLHTIDLAKSEESKGFLEQLDATEMVRVRRVEFEQESENTDTPLQAA